MPNQLKKCYHSLWSALHYLSFSVSTREEKEGLLQMLSGLSECLPCSKCREHLRNFQRSHRPGSGDKAYARYILELHNDVNRRNGRRPWTLSEAEKAYGNMVKGCGVFEQNDDGTFHDPVQRRKTISLWASCSLIALLMVIVGVLCFRTCDMAGCSVEKK